MRRTVVCEYDWLIDWKGKKKSHRCTGLTVRHPTPDQSCRVINNNMTNHSSLLTWVISFDSIGLVLPLYCCSALSPLLCSLLTTGRSLWAFYVNVNQRWSCFQHCDSLTLEQHSLKFADKLMLIFNWKKISQTLLCSLQIMCLLSFYDLLSLTWMHETSWNWNYLSIYKWRFSCLFFVLIDYLG